MTAKPSKSKATLSILLQDSLEALPEVIEYRRRHTDCPIYFIGLTAIDRDTKGRNWTCRDTCAGFPRQVYGAARRRLDALRETYDLGHAALAN